MIIFQKKNVNTKIISELLSTHPSIKSRKKKSEILSAYKANVVNYKDYRERFVNQVDGMTLYSGKTSGVPEKYIISYQLAKDLKEIQNNKELLEYILLINQVDTLQDLDNKNRVKLILKY